jgi:hypothetical protein
MYDLGDSYIERILIFQNEIDRLKLKRELTYDAFMESNRYDGKKLREDLKIPNNASHGGIYNLECVIKRVRVFGDKLEFVD